MMQYFLTHNEESGRIMTFRAQELPYVFDLKQWFSTESRLREGS